MITLYHFWSAPQAQRVRLALGYKRVPHEDRAMDYHDDETFFALGLARQVPVLRLGDRLLTDSFAILREIDALFPDTPPLVEGRIAEVDWHAVLDWRSRVDAVLSRLWAAAKPAYRDIAPALDAYKAEVRSDFGLSLEELANDRYAGYEQLSRLSRLPALARHLAERRFYMGRPSIADMVLAADLFPLQLLDGLELPIDLMYYISRVEEASAVSLRAGLVATVRGG